MQRAVSPSGRRNENVSPGARYLIIVTQVRIAYGRYRGDRGESHWHVPAAGMRAGAGAWKTARLGLGGILARQVELFGAHVAGNYAAWKWPVESGRLTLE